jgi:anti-anti-sigma factor
VTELARLTLEQRDGVHIASIDGEVDVANASSLQEDIAAAVSNTAHGLVIDLTQTEYFDSAGIRMLFELHKTLAGRRQELRVVVPRGAVILSALLVTEIDQLVPIDDDLQEAVARLGDQERRTA